MTADVKDVGYVVVRFLFIFLVSSLSYSYQNFDFPNNCEDYIHRIGRTGVRGVVSVGDIDESYHSLQQRAGAKGVSYTYFTTESSKSARDLLSILREAKASIPHELEQMAMYSGGRRSSSFLRGWQS